MPKKNKENLIKYNGAEVFRNNDENRDLLADMRSFEMSLDY
jgi:hypothetical protein